MYHTRSDIKRSVCVFVIVLVLWCVGCVACVPHFPAWAETAPQAVAPTSFSSMSTATAMGNGVGISMFYKRNPVVLDGVMQYSQTL